MFLPNDGVDFRIWPHIVQAVCLSLILNAYFALRVLQDARKRNLPRRAGRVFAIVTLFTSFVGIAAYMFYETTRRTKAPGGLAGARKSPGTIILLVEIGLAALIVGVIYFVVTRAILLGKP